MPLDREQHRLGDQQQRRDAHVPPAPRRPCSRSSAFIARVTSTVRNSVTCGAVNADATMFSAVSLRTPLTGIRCSRSAPKHRRRRRPRAAPAGSAGPLAACDVVAGDRALRPRAGQAVAGRRRGPGRACGPAAWPAPTRPSSDRARLAAELGAGAAGAAAAEPSDCGDRCGAPSLRGRASRRSFAGRSRPGRPCGRPGPGHRSGRARPRPRPARPRPRPATRPTARAAAPTARVGRTASPAPGSVSIAMIGEPTSTVVPSSVVDLRAPVPAHFAGISTAAFAVSTSTIGWFSSMVSPT